MGKKERAPLFQFYFTSMILAPFLESECGPWIMEPSFSYKGPSYGNTLSDKLDKAVKRNLNLFLDYKEIESREGEKRRTSLSGTMHPDVVFSLVTSFLYTLLHLYSEVIKHLFSRHGEWNGKKK